MKVQFLAVALIALACGNVSADPVIGSTYFIAPGAGTESGFQLAGGPFDGSVIDGQGELIGTDLSGLGMVLSSDSLTHNGGNNFDFVLRIESIGGNLAPTGVMGDSGGELTTLGLFVGGGLDPVDLSGPVIAETAQIEVFDTAGQSIGTIDVSGLSNFTTGIGGGWDGSLGLNFGNQITIGDVGAVELQINFNSSVPEPATAGSLALLAGLTLLRRRRV